MAYNNTSIKEDLMENAVRVYDGMSVVYPRTGEQKPLSISEIVPKFNGCFAVNNSTVCFVTTDGNVYVTPWTTGITNKLCDAKFQEKVFYVPFSNGDYPFYEKEKWERLYRNAKEYNFQNQAIKIMEACEKYCKRNNVRKLNKEDYENCMEIYSSGIEVHSHGYTDCYYPINVDVENVQNTIGHYNINNGVIIFVNDEGRTFLSKGKKFLQKLVSNGYQKANFFVPLSNWEEISNPILHGKWESIKK